MKFKQNDAVKIHSLGPSYGDQTFTGKVVGIAVDLGEESGATIWIVECPALAEQIGFTHVTMLSACQPVTHLMKMAMQEDCGVWE